MNHVLETASRLAFFSSLLMELSQILDEPPIFIYSDYTLRNSRLIDNSEAASLENLESIYTFSGTKDEDQFVVVHTAYEHAGIPAIRAAIEVVANALSQDDIIRKLDIITNCISDMRHEFMKVRSIVSPATFRDKTRLFLMGWHSNLPAIEYEGVEFDASMLRGETGAGSVLLPFLDRFAELLPFSNEDDDCADHLKTYLDFDSHRPLWHREALNWIASETKLREQALVSHEVAVSYNTMAEQIVGLRTDHLRTVGAYMKGSSHPNMQDGYGTGGSSYTEYLLALVNMSKKRLVT